MFIYLTVYTRCYKSARETERRLNGPLIKSQLTLFLNRDIDFDSPRNKKRLNFSLNQIKQIYVKKATLQK